MITVILVIILFVVLIFPHELGHFLMAKAVGVKVNEFAFGMGPAIFKKQGKETLYSIRVFPIGGYCAMEGEDEAPEGDEKNPRAFVNKPAWAKLLVLFAGAGMNIIICVIVMTIVMGVVGSPTTTLSEVQAGSPAYEAGLLEGDRITAVNGVEIKDWNDFGDTVQKNADGLDLTYIRDGSEYTVHITPVKTDDRLLIGVVSRVSHSPGTAIKNGFIQSGRMVTSLFDGLKMLVTGKAGVNDLTGPVGMISLVHQTRSYGLVNFFYLLGFVSMNLAVINLLPLPALDGGRILFVIIRLFVKKNLSNRVEGMIHAVGMLLLIGLMIYVTFHDVIRLAR